MNTYVAIINNTTTHRSAELRADNVKNLRKAVRDWCYTHTGDLQHSEWYIARANEQGQPVSPTLYGGYYDRQGYLNPREYKEWKN